ncbi:OmpA family protein [Paraburkholderia panacisoli]|uniref:OmpA family protein n=1 Tax=Paraburkholderia panacisoli TaxID=2603818 RepID=A0A5B0G2K7_9BURK|nr:OmpA family protein [Paraburkholderia panacisoli]KAA0997472.1 OmpA family protein [Paraburkholderia panacisoli]
MRPIQFVRGIAGLVGTALLLSGCVSQQKYDTLQDEYNQLNQSLSSEVAQQKVHIERLQGAIKVNVNSELLFPSGGWEMPPEAAQTIAKMAPILAPMQQTKLLINGYTDSTPIGPELRAKGVENNQQLSLKRAQTVANFLISQGVKPNLVSAEGFGETNPVASNDTPEGRAQNRRVEITIAGSGT